MDKKRMKRMIGIAIPMALIITGISYNGYIRMHTFTLSGEVVKNELIQPINNKIKVSGNADTDVIFTDIESRKQYTIGYITHGMSETIQLDFCSNFLMVQDKANGTIRDLRISPVKSATLSLSYYTATLFSTLIICFAATGICLTYVAIVGWNMSLADIFFLFLDILLLVLFGTALSSIINFFLSTQGQISAVGTIISAGYGFICGAYMPISSFGKGLQKIISFLPGTYGTSLIRNHTMQGALAEIQNQGIPIVIIEKLKDSLDCNLYFFGSQVNIGTMYMILGITILVLIGIYILLNKSKKYNR